MGECIIEIERIPRDIIEKLRGIPTGNISDAMGKIGSMSSAIKPIYKEAYLIGPAVTVRCPVRDNLTIHKAIYVAQPGDVLVVDAGGHPEGGLFGGIMALAARMRGIAGLILEGACRDAEDFKELDFPAFCISLNPGGTVKETFGSINKPIQCGGAIVLPGDIVIGDCDGVVVVPKDKASEVIEKARAIFEKEIKIREELKKGKSTLEIFGFDKILREKGVIESGKG